MMERTARIAGLLALALLLPTVAGAQTLADYDYENLRFRGVGTDIGYIAPNRVDGTTVFSVRFDLGYLGPAVRIVPSVSYWKSHLKRSELQRFANRLEQIPALRDQNVSISADDLGIVEWNDVGLGLDAHVVWTTPYRVFTYVGAGFGLHVMNGRGGAVEGTFIEDLLDSTPAAISVMGGLEYEPTRRLRLYGEGRYTLQSDLRYPTVRLGLAVMFAPAVNALRRLP
jgi:opacity protein-like surface antigen